MCDNLPYLKADPDFRNRAAGLVAQAGAADIRPLDPMFDHFQHFTAVRRREVRVSRLEKAGRVDAQDWRSHRERVPQAVSAFGTGLKILAEHAATLRMIITPTLDDVIALAADENHPLHKTLNAAAISLGFSNEETGWLFDELRAIHYRPVHLLCAGGFDDLAALLAGISVGESGLLIAGFTRFTGDPDTDERLKRLVIRLRGQGATASIFLALVIILTAHFVATHEDQ